MEGHMFHYNGGHNWAWYSFKHTFKSYSDVTKDKNIYISQQTLDIALDTLNKFTATRDVRLPTQYDNLIVYGYAANANDILLDWLTENNVKWRQFTYLNDNDGLKLDIFWCQWIQDWFYHLQHARDPNDLKTENSWEFTHIQTKTNWLNDFCVLIFWTQTAQQLETWLTNKWAKKTDCIKSSSSKRDCDNKNGQLHWTNVFTWPKTDTSTAHNRWYCI